MTDHTERDDLGWLVTSDPDDRAKARRGGGNDPSAVARMILGEALAAEARGTVEGDPGSVLIDGMPWWEWVADIAIRLVDSSQVGDP